MAKTPKPKKREPTVHSRAHRRNASPPPKDLAVKAPAEDESEYRPWLHNAQNAGVSKRKKSKQLTRQQKVRQQKAIEKADATLEKLAMKVKDSKARGRKVQARRAGWEELNWSVVTQEKAANGVDAADASEDDGLEAEDGVELDVGMREPEPDETGTKKDVEAARTVPLPEPEEDEEL